MHSKQYTHPPIFRKKKVGYLAKDRKSKIKELVEQYLWLAKSSPTVFGPGSIKPPLYSCFLIHIADSAQTGYCPTFPCPCVC